MFKKLALLSVVLSLGACETIVEKTTCEPEKNFEYTNISAMEKYRKEYSKKSPTSIYYESLPAKYCNDDLCIRFDDKNFKYIEKNFDDSLRKGVYTISESNSSETNNCLPRSPALEGVLPIKCYIAVKNNNNQIKSEYKFKIQNDNNRTLIEFKNIKTDETLYQKSYQIYSTGAIGGPGFSYCKPFKINNPDYNYNALSFPTNNK